ncbi:hypothetical protein [Streptomyces abyssalis]|uniref:hypothetical protein n=1 Tax=Streptomyces abyssalis TaxID=933944 RepID=UPI001112CB0A|nr:hypothetical protein [Streptomyces abyssalis]
MSGNSPVGLRSSEELALLVSSALRGTDIAVAFSAVNRGKHAKKCPRRLLPKSEVLAPKPKPKPQPATWYQKFAVGAVVFGAWLMAPFDFIGDALWSLVQRIFRGIRWVFRTPERRRRRTQLKGGWKSLAGGLDTSMCIHGHKVLVVGERRLSLVYVGVDDSEIGWHHPLTDVARVEVATWRSTDDRGATLRWHFRDGSWADVFAKGPGWKALASAVPNS